MAMQVKHMLTVGLGLGVVTALGYHFLSSSQYEPVSENAGQMAPLSRFELAPQNTTPLASLNPPAVSESTAFSVSTPTPAQPQVDNQFRSDATPLRTSTFDQAVKSVESNSSYKELVTAVQANAPASAQPVGFQQLSSDTENSEDSFSLDLSAPESSKAPEFVFEDPDQTSQQLDSQEPSSLKLDLSVADTDKKMVEVIASQGQDRSTPAVVDFQSNSMDQSADKNAKPKANTWKQNPFINNGSDASVATRPGSSESPSTLEFPESAEQPHASSVLSLNDPAHENLAATAEPFRTMPATTIPDSIQPYQQPVVNDQLAGHSTQLAPSGQMAINSADALKAVHHIEYGKTLSRRGAAHTARQEFLAAMQLVAAANDKTSGDNRHTKALRSAMLTIKEAGDFSVASSEQQIQMDVALVVESHRSKVLTNTQAANLSPVQAMNRYFAKAQEQLDLAGGRNVVSAEVFYCMGKLHTVLSRSKKVLGPYETAQSVVYHQVALLSDNQHHRSANELGVLLARSGRLEQSKLLFERSLMSQPTVRTWQNLAEAHRRLGETNFANQATREVQLLASGQLPASQSNIQWKPIDQFNADAPVEFNQRVAQLPSPPVTPATAPTPADKPSPAKSIADRIKGIF